MKALLLTLLCSCSISRYAIQGECAATPTLVVDVLLSGVGLAGSVEAYGSDQPAMAAALFAAAMGVALSANVAETACR